MIGGGIAGLASAHFLSAAGAHVTLFESADGFGGLGASFLYGDCNLDCFYHVILPSDTHLRGLAGALGMGERMYWRESSLGFIYRRRLYPLKGPVDLLRFGGVPLLDRVRLGLTSLYASHLARPDRLDDITAEEWLTRLSGRRAFERLWRPLLIAKFGDAYRHVPALWYWASFTREKGTGKEIKGSMRGGYSALTERLVSTLRGRDAELRTGWEVDRLDVGADGRPILEAGPMNRTFDRVVSTVPLADLRRICRQGACARALHGVDAGIDYQGVVNVLVLLRRPLTRHYWIPVVESGVPFHGIVETTHVLELAETGGHHLVYLLNYVHRTSPLFQMDPVQIRDEYVAALLDLFPDVSREDVTDAFVFKAPFVEPLYTPGYGSRKPPAELVPGRVFLATTTQIYPQVTSWNSSIGLAESVVREMSRAAAFYP